MRRLPKRKRMELSDKQIEELSAAVASNHPHRERAMALIEVSNGATQMQAATVAKVERRSVARWVAAVVSAQSIAEVLGNRPTGRPQKLHAEVHAEVRSVIFRRLLAVRGDGRKESVWTDICRTVRYVCRVNLSETTVRRIAMSDNRVTKRLDEMGITFRLWRDPSSKRWHKQGG